MSGGRVGDFASRWRAAGYPWCDVCDAPVRYFAGVGFRHISEDHPDGLPSARHQPSAYAWWSSPLPTTPFVGFTAGGEGDAL